MRRYRNGFTGVGCIAAALLLGSCSTDGDTSANASASLPSSDPTTDSALAADTRSASTTLSSDSTTTIATIVTTATTATTGSPVPSPTRTDESTTSTTMLSFTGDPNSQWCVVAAELVVLSAAFEAAPVSDPDEIERTFTAFVDRMTLIAFIAPPEIADDVALSVGAFGDMLVMLEAAAFDLAAADLSTIDAQRETLEESSNRIATYNSDVCALGPDAGAASEGTGAPVPAASTTTTVASATESRRDAAIDLLIGSGYTAEEAECIVNEIENGLLTQDVLSACGVFLEGSTP